MKKISQVLKDFKFWIFGIITILFFGIFIKTEFAIDTYPVIVTSTIQMVKHFLASGRFITAIMQLIVVYLRLDLNTIYFMTFILSIFCTTVSIYKLYNIFYKETNNNVISAISAIFIIINIFSIELYLFIEKGIMMLSVLFCVLAFEQLIRYFDGNKKSIIYTLIYMLLANFSYQGTVALFAVLATLYVIKNTKSIKTFINSNLIMGVCYAIPATINYLIVKIIFGNVRVSGEINLLTSIRKIVSETKYMIMTSYEIIPKYIYIGMLLLLFIIIIVCFIKKVDNRKRIWLILGSIYICIATFAFTIFPQIMQSTNYIWFAPRSTYAFASLLGIWLIYLYMNCDVNLKLNKVIIVTAIIYLAIQYIGFQDIARSRYILNYMEKYNCMEIKENIEKYEQTTENKVTKVAFYRSPKQQYTYPDIYYNRDINVKASYIKASRLYLLDYYLNKELEEVSQEDEIYNRYFKEKSWEFFNEDQLVFQGNTLHLYLY